jgi:hypothetical protein
MTIFRLDWGYVNNVLNKERGVIRYVLYYNLRNVWYQR